METNEKCPRCKEGKLVERVSFEDEPDTMNSLIFGAALGMGYFPMTREVKYGNYTCSKNCGYTEKRKK